MTERLNGTWVLDISSRVQNFVLYVLIKVIGTYPFPCLTCIEDIVDNKDLHMKEIQRP